MKKLVVCLVAVVASLLMLPGVAWATPQDPSADQCVASGLASAEAAADAADELGEDAQPYVYFQCELSSDGIEYSVWLSTDPLERPDQEEGELATLSVPSRSEMAQILRGEWNALSENVPFSQYGITAEDVSGYYFEAVGDNPDCFNVKPQFGWMYDTKTGYVESISPRYLETDPAEYETMKAAFDAAVAEGLAVLGCGEVAPVDRVKLIHDWLCGRASYNHNQGSQESVEFWKNHTAYGVLVERKGVCQSYTLALSTLLNAAGVETTVIDAREMTHTWNLVNIDQHWYHVDVTWADQSWGVYYDFFMKSDQHYLNRPDPKDRHYGWDVGWEGQSYGWRPELACTDTSRDNFNWNSYTAQPGDSDHTWGAWSTTVPATCKTGETQERTCSVCGAKDSRVTDVLGDHQWGSWAAGTAATCKSLATEVRHCELCNAEDSQEVDGFADHQWGAWSTQKPATCVKGATLLRACSVCGEKDTKEDSVLGDHQWGSWAAGSPATCKSLATEVRHCELCNAEDSREVDGFADHQWGAWTAHEAATCEKRATEIHTCLTCGEKETREVGELAAHTWGAWSVREPATCKQGEIQEHTCLVCGTKDTKEGTELGAHQWGSWAAGTAATCKDLATEVRACTLCGEKDTKSVGELGDHQWTWVTDGVTCTSDGVKAEKCIYCDETRDHVAAPAKGHTFKGGQCTACGAHKGDVNGNGVVNIVDVQLAYDIACNRFDAGQVASINAAVNGGLRPIANDAFAIQHAIIYGW